MDIAGLEEAVLHHEEKNDPTDSDDYRSDSVLHGLVYERTKLHSFYGAGKATGTDDRKHCLPRNTENHEAIRICKRSGKCATIS